MELCDASLVSKVSLPRNVLLRNNMRGGRLNSGGSSGNMLGAAGGGPQSRYAQVAAFEGFDQSASQTHDSSHAADNTFASANEAQLPFRQSVADQTQQHMLKVYLEKKKRLQDSLKK